MKKIIFLISMFFALTLSAQVKIGNNPTTINPSSLLELESTTKGFLPPRMTNQQMTTIATPATGLMVYCTNCSPAGLRVYNGSAWAELGGGSSSPSVVADCNVNGFVGGAYMNGAALSGASFSTTITNNSISTADLSFAAGDLVLSGVTGLTVGTPTPTSATLTAGQSKLVSYPITGTPATAGTLTGTWSKLTLSCSDTQTVAALSASMNADYCNSTVYNGTYVSGVAFTSSNTFAVTFTNTSGSAINGLAAPAVGNLALTWTGGGTLSVASVSPTGTYNLPAGASKTFTYTLSGTPSSIGTLTGVWTYRDLTCTKVRNIGLGDATFTLPQSKYVVSIYDGTPLVDIQGYITNTAPNKFVINVPYTGGSGSYNAYTSSVVTGTAGEGGDVNGFSISYPGGTFSASGNIAVTVTVGGDGTYRAKKKLFGASEIIATLPFQLNGVTRGNIQLGVFGGIPDRMFGLADKNGNTNTHKFIYIPITGPDGETWLNNNLGAHYANMNYGGFNPVKQATGATDHLAYGSLFQWGRKPDGHELITYANSTTGSPLNGTITGNSNDPLDASFIYAAGSPYDWRSTQDPALWATEASANNPCPQGYRVPTLTEQDTLVTAANITNSATAASSTLKFTVPGYRYGAAGTLYNVGSSGRYWSSSDSGTNASYRSFYAGGTGPVNDYRSYGLAVRCIQD